MPVAAVVTIAQALLPLIPQLIAEVETLGNKGEIPVEVQASLKASYDALKAAVEKGAFTGPEWQIDP